jgi:hypothetical protein
MKKYVTSLDGMNSSLTLRYDDAEPELHCKVDDTLFEWSERSFKFVKLRNFRNQEIERLEYLHVRITSDMSTTESEQ